MTVVQANQVFGAQVGMQMLFGTVRLADDGQFDPAERLREALAQASISEEEFWLLDFGEGRDVPS